MRTAPINNITNAVVLLLVQLQDLLRQMDDKQYTRPLEVLSNASVGQHIRHIIEFFLELNTGYVNGVVNYDARKRDIEIETNRTSALIKIHHIIAGLDKAHKLLVFQADFSNEGMALVSVHSNYSRELIYNLEHTVHHMALLRIGVSTLDSISLPEKFGVATSTLKYRKACAQ